MFAIFRAMQRTIIEKFKSLENWVYKKARWKVVTCGIKNNP